MYTKIFTYPHDICRAPAHQWRLAAIYAASLLAVLTAILVVVWPVKQSAIAQTANTFFSPDVTITVPQLDANGDGVNDYSGTSLRVEFILPSTPGCLTYYETRELPFGTYVVQGNGTVIETSTAVLLDRFGGDDVNCVYIVGWPAVAGLSSSADRTATVQASEKMALVNYVAGANWFKAARWNEISIPQSDTNGDGENDFAGTRFILEFRRTGGSDAGCTTLGQLGNSVKSSGGLLRSGGVRLVDYPAGVQIQCQYDVVWPVVPGWVLQPGATTRVSASSSVVSGEYVAIAATYFTPEVTINVPQLDETGDGVNDFSGTEFTISFRPAYGFASSCPAVTRGTYVVQDSGTVSEVSAPVLVDRPEGKTINCIYRSDFIRSKPGLQYDWEKTQFFNKPVSTSDPSFAIFYTTAATRFRTLVRIHAPQLDTYREGRNNFEGKSLRVAYERVSGSDPGCTASKGGTHSVPPSGIIWSSDLGLVDYPVGERTSCSYDVIWPEVPGWVLQPGATARVSASAREISARYSAVAATYFTPDVTITVPQLDADGDGDNDYFGTSLRVIFRRVEGSDMGCTRVTGVDLVVQGSGVVTGPSEPVLVDRPEGVGTSCNYRVIWPELGGTERQRHQPAGTPTEVSASAKSVSANYVAATNWYWPSIKIFIPDLDVNGDGVNYFSGTEFVVELRRVEVSHADCTASASGTYEAQDNGKVKLARARPHKIVAHPAGVIEHCQYELTWPVVDGLEYFNPTGHVS